MSFKSIQQTVHIELPRDGTLIRIDYVNHKGVRDWRVIEPIKIWFGRSVHHNEKAQWFLRAIAHDRARETRDFAMNDIFDVL